MKSIRFVSLIAVIVGFFGLTPPLFAHEEGACREDVKKLCGDVKPGGGAIADCLKTHADSLSQGCKENMAEGKKKLEERKKELDAACKADLKQFCANVTPGQGREMACLKSYEDKISAGCKEKLPHRGMGKPMGMHHGDKNKGGADMGASDKGEPDQEIPAPPPGK